MKKLLSKIITVTVILILVLSFATACEESTKKNNNAKVVTTPQPSSKAFRGELTFSGYKSFDKDDSNFNYISTFHSEYPGVDVSYDECAEEEYFSTLDERILDGSIGDVFVIDSVRLAKYADMGLLVDLTPYLDGLISYKTFKKLVPSDILFKSAYESCLYNGKYYMSALEYSHEFVLLNYSAFEKAGLSSPNDKWTWDDLYEYADKLKDIEGIDAAVALDYTDYAVWGAFARSYGDNVFTYDSFGNIVNINLTEKNVIEGLQELSDLAKKDYVKSVSMKDLPAEDLSKYAIIVCDRDDFERWSPYLEKADSSEYNWDLIHFPRFVRDGFNEEGEPAKVTYYSIGAKSCGLAVRVRDDFEDSDELKNHYEMCAALTLYSLEESAAISYSNEGESVPAMKSVNNMKFWREYPVAGKNTSVFSLFNSNDYVSILTPYINYDASLEFDVGNAIKECVENDVPLRETLQKIQDAANSKM